MNTLTPEEYHILIEKGNERPYTGEYRDLHADGIYICRQCNSPLYWSDNKFDSHCWWPSFDDAIPWKVLMQTDQDKTRTEIVCNSCKGHLWHIFVGEQQTDKNTRHCVNSLSMRFIKKENISEEIIWKIPSYEIALLGWWCFWCIEWALQKLPGIIEIRSGYMGGKRPFPTYERICTGVSWYIEIVQIFFDSNILNYEDILGYFFAIHDPTSKDKQWNDIGSQYRSVIFTVSNEQKNKAEVIIDKLNWSWFYEKKIVTEIRPAEVFYLAEDYHQNFYQNNPNKPYCQIIVKPKIEKIESLLNRT